MVTRYNVNTDVRNSFDLVSIRDTRYRVNMPYLCNICGKTIPKNTPHAHYAKKFKGSH